MDTTVLLSAISVLGAVVAYLYRSLAKQNSDAVKVLRAELSARDRSIDDLVKRVRSLEEARLDETKAHAIEIKDLAVKIIGAMKDTHVLVRQVVASLDAQTKALVSKPCLGDFHPHPTPKPDAQAPTETLLKTIEDPHRIHG